ncbi:MAG: hypothetical protein JO257_08005 [Deltaproteobacteria bacterium]|nr:hypothetical protein [Deltaproteobacteria bacterium]
MHAVTSVFIGGEPVEQREAVIGIVEQVLGILDVEPRELWVSKPDGRPVRDRAFTPERFREAVDAMAIAHGHGIKRSKAQLFLWVALRHGVKVSAPTKYAPPQLAFSVEIGERVPEARAIAAGEHLLRQAAAALPVVSGGLTCFESGEVANTEISFVSVSRPKTPEQVRLRQSIDQSREGQLWKKARRIYWETLLGTSLATKLGGAAGARAAGAASVEECAGSLLVHAGGPLEPDDAPAFRARAAGLRSWLWPHSIQNPVDNPEAT